jgi:hypothetical protein
LNKLPPCAIFSANVCHAKILGRTCWEYNSIEIAGRRPLQYNKKGKAGHDERFALLEPIFGHWLSAALAERHILASTKDDVLGQCRQCQRLIH